MTRDLDLEVCFAGEPQGPLWGVPKPFSGDHFLGHLSVQLGEKIQPHQFQRKISKLFKTLMAP
eukprot:2743285-Amphidinium_carterae.1